MLRISDLAIYKYNRSFSKDYRRLPLFELCRWVWFSFTVIFSIPIRKVSGATVVCLYSSQNQWRALNNKFPEYLRLNIFNDRNDASNFKARFFFLFLVCSLLGPPLLLLSAFYALFPRYSFYLSAVCLYCALYASLFRLGGNLKLVVSNDHAYYFRALINSNKDVSYVQHGAIGRNFPPLDSFSKVYLDNRFSLKRYPEPCTRVEVICGVEVATPSHRGLTFNDGFILIFMNNQRCQKQLAELVSKVRDAYPNPIQVRLHPSIEAIDLDLKVDVIRARELPLERHILGAHFCIAGASTVVIDCARMCVPVFYYPLDDYGDMYGFLEHRIVERLSFVSDISLQTPSSVLERLNE